MARGGRFMKFLEVYTRVVWAVVATVILIGLLFCVAGHMCKYGKVCHKTAHIELKK